MKRWRVSGGMPPSLIFITTFSWRGVCFAETNISLAGVASFHLTYFNLIQFNLT
jgi:hypothetical protein